MCVITLVRDTHANVSMVSKATHISLKDEDANIDEGANHKDYNCPMQTHCVNTEGSYLCVLNGERKRMSRLLIAFLVAVLHVDMAKASKDESSKNKAEILQEKLGFTASHIVVLAVNPRFS
ncbi:hypothetical protein OROMI_032099 [Orobanche minor]